MSKYPDQEQKLLALLIAESPDASPFLTDILGSSEEIDWQRFGDLIKRHRVGALVHAGLAKFAALPLPAELAEVLAQNAADNVFAYMLSLKVTAELTKAFSEADICSAALKGCAVAAQYYSTPSHREMIDVDVLVDRDRLRDAEDIVQSLGFVRFLPKSDLSDSQRESFLEMHNAFGFIRKSDGVQLDLHWQMVHNPAILPRFDGSWPSMVVTSDIAGQPIPTLNAAAHFVYICVHGAKSGWTRLKWLVDVDRVLCGLSDEELLGAAHLFEAHDLGRIGAASVLLSKQIFGTPTPPAFAKMVQQHDARKLIELELSMIFADTPASPPRLRDWRHFARRIHHSLILHRAKGYRRHALLREMANPLDLETVSVPRKFLWALGIITPVLGIGRLIGRTIGSGRN